MSFAEAYGNILLPFIENYKAGKNEKVRKAVVETAANTILNSRNLLEEQGLDLPLDSKAVCVLLLYPFHALSHPLTMDKYRLSGGT
jgi:hypothetical protein